VRLLLDTHIALWAIVNSPRLPAAAKTLISASDAELFVSAVSLWEVAIKYSLKRGAPDDMPISSSHFARRLAGARCEILEVRGVHLERLEKLPWLHRDPFDRMLVAQAMAEPVRLLTVDGRMAAYGQPIERV
jgi:PIN domain nuclease of toxin-antitoxin system